MKTLYSFLTQIASFHLWVAQHFSKKLKTFVSGRKDVFTILERDISAKDKTIWFHCASLGEFEQAVPIIEATKKLFTSHKIIISFFSPSGYEIKKNSNLADSIIYLPLDTISNTTKFIKKAHPSLAIFVKYEFWPNYLFELKKNQIPTLLVSGLFRANQSFFKPYGGFMRKALLSFNHFFVQDPASQELLKKINITNTTISGDTRFDRVSRQIEQDNTIDFMDTFKGDSICIVCGSTWPEDEVILLDAINSAADEVKYVIAPHKMDANKLNTFRKKINQPTALYSEIISPSGALEDEKLIDSKILIIDTIGLLTKIYSYADIAYVGGAAGNTGLHNILEPATFGVPILIGDNFDKFPEAKKLQQLAGLYSVKSGEECTQTLSKLINDRSFRSKTGMITEHFINSNTGATKKIMNYIQKLHRDGIV
ncbi:MAG: 3-deoxy-D-manno-octulosonic-acid transferase [Flavobacteriaceae bacterium]|jgi:3-deoxy-D-manno-octulosonic-acid transferase